MPDTTQDSNKDLNKLAAILAKAENNPNAAEAEIAFERAVRLSQRMGIDLAVARAHQAGKEREVPISKRIKVGDPKRNSNRHMMDLFLAIAHQNDAQVAISGESVKRGNGYDRYSAAQRRDAEYMGIDLKRPQDWDDEDRNWVETVIGEPDEYVSGYRHAEAIYAHITAFPSDIDVIERLYAVASTQMVMQASRGITKGEHKEKRDSYTNDEGERIWYTKKGISAKTWRANFYQGFTLRIEERLIAAKREARKEALALESGSGPSTALVLAEKTEEVEAAYRKKNPHFYNEDGSKKGNAKSYQGASTSTFSASAVTMGSLAAEKVSLGFEQAVGGSSTRGAIGA